MSSEPSNLQIRVLATLARHNDRVNSVAFDPTGRFLATGSDDYRAIVWRISRDGAAATCVATLPWLAGHSNCVTSVAFDPTGRFVATGSADKTATLWEIKPFGGGRRDDRFFRTGRRGILTHGGRISVRKNKRSNRKYKKIVLRRSRKIICNNLPYNLNITNLSLRIQTGTASENKFTTFIFKGIGCKNYQFYIVK